MRRIVSTRNQFLVGLAVWLGTAVTLNTMGIGLRRLAIVASRASCRVLLDHPRAMPMRKAEVPRATVDRLPEIAKKESRIVPELR